MATNLENLETAKARIITELAEGDIKPNYSVGGQSVSWTEYRNSLLEQLAKLNDLIQVEGGPIEVVSQGVTGGTSRP